MEDENLVMFTEEELPVTDEPKKKKKEVENCLQDILLELMERDKVSLADVQRSTGIPWGSLYGWYKGDVQAQMLDWNIFKLAKFFNVSIHYLAFGVGDDSNVFDNDDDKTGGINQ
jgi:hypothetical protein